MPPRWEWDCPGGGDAVPEHRGAPMELCWGGWHWGGRDTVPEQHGDLDVRVRWGGVLER